MNGWKTTTPHQTPSRLRRVNRLVDNLPVGLVLLAFVSAGAAALTVGFGAAGADKADVELRVGYAYRNVANPCEEILPFGLVVPASYASVTKCIEIHNRSNATVFGLTVTDPDVGDGPTVIESLASGDRVAFHAAVESDGDLISTTTLSVDTPGLVLEAESRTFVVEGAKIAGGMMAGTTGEVDLTGRTQSGHKLDRTSLVGADGRFVFDDLPPSNLRGYWLSHGDTALLERTIIVAPGDQVSVSSSVDVTPEPAVVATSSTVVENALVDAPAALAFDPTPERSTVPYQTPLLVLAGLIVALAIPARRAPPTGR